jgi:hypothetical protein
MTPNALVPDPLDDPRLVTAKRRMAEAILTQYSTVCLMRARGESLGVFAEVFR